MVGGVLRAQNCLRQKKQCRGFGLSSLLHSSEADGCVYLPVLLSGAFFLVV